MTSIQKSVLLTAIIMGIIGFIGMTIGVIMPQLGYDSGSDSIAGIIGTGGFLLMMLGGLPLMFIFRPNISKDENNG